MSRELLQQALDALDDPSTFRKTFNARAALRAALAAPEPEPVALESVHLTRDTRGMCVVRVNGRVAIRDNGDIIDHMATLEWFATPPAAPAPAAPVPDGWVMVPREPNEAMMDAGERAFIATARPGATWAEHTGNIYRAMIAASPAAPAAPVVREPLTEGRITGIANELAFGGGHCNVYELARAIEAAHGITGGKP